MSNELKIFAGLNHIRKSSPHLFSLLDITEINIEEKIPTALVFWNKKSKKFNIKISQNFVDNLDSLNLAAIIEHELLHVLFEHLFDDTMPNKQIANIAMDSIINDTIKIFLDDKADKLLDSRVKLRNISKDFNVSKNTSLEVYKYLEQNAKKMPKDADGIDDHGEFSNADDNGENGNDSGIDELEKAIAKAAVANVVEKNLNDFQAAGNKCAEISRVVTEMMKVAYNFKSLFENAVKKSLRSDLVRTWKKPNRRLGDLCKGVKAAVKPNVLLLVDTSGSINDEILAKINWQIAFLSKFYNFTVCWGDTQLEGSKKIKKGQKVTIPYSGFGGTDLGFYEELTKKENFDLIVFNTDGFIPEINPECKIKKIFCIFDGGRVVPGYKNIELR